MNDLEQSKIRDFVADELMYKAVKKVLLSVTEVNLDKYADYANNNEQLGEEVRAMAKGKKFVEKGFEKLLGYEKGETPTKRKNPAI